jgi:hypothetical protein
MREVPALGQVPGLQDGQKLGLVWSIVEDKSLPQRDVEKLVEFVRIRTQPAGM